MRLLLAHFVGGILCIIWRVYLGEIRNTALKDGSPTLQILFCLMVWEIVAAVYFIDFLDNTIKKYYKQKRQE